MDHAEGFAAGQRWGQLIADWVRDEVAPEVQRMVAAGEDPTPALRGVAGALRGTADSLDPDTGGAAS